MTKTKKISLALLKLAKTKFGILALAGIITVALTGYITNSKVSALQSVLPYDGITVPSTDQNDIYLEHAQIGSDTKNYLGADPAYAKLYFKAPNGSGNFVVQLFDGVFNANSPVDYLGNRTENDAVDYNFYATYPDSEGRKCKILTISSSSGKMAANNWSSNISIPSNDANCSANQASTNTGYYTIQFEANFKTAPPTFGRINAFKIKVINADSYVGFWSRLGPDDQPIAIQNKDFDLPDSHNNDFLLQFGAPCSFSSGTEEQAKLKWNDADHADAGGQPQDADIHFRVKDVTTGQYVKIYNSNYAPEGTNRSGGVTDVTDADWIGGQDALRQAYYYAKVGHDYQWEWYSIQRNNGLQFWAPYDSINYILSCADYDNRINFELPSTVPGGSDGYPSGGQVFAGHTYTIGTRIYNQGDQDAPQTEGVVEDVNSGKLSGQDAADPTANPLKADAAGYWDASKADPDYNCGGRVTTEATAKTPCYFWHYGGNGAGNQLKKNGTAANSRDTTFTFTVRDNATGTVCFNAFVYRQNSDIARFGDPTDVTGKTHQCFDIVQPTYPYVTTEGGNVHAGRTQNGPCYVYDGSAGRISGQIDSTNSYGSKGDYIVSAGGPINNFGSFSPNPGTITRVNNGQNYGTVCHRDVPVDASDGNIDNQTIVNSNGAGPYNLGNIGGKTSVNPYGMTNQGVQSFGVAGNNNANVTIDASTIGKGQKLTIIVYGDVKITGNIIPANGASLSTISQIPSLAIIATRSIKIGSGVTGLYGVYMAGSNIGNSQGFINTCQNSFDDDNTPDIGTVAGATTCNGALKVTGALVATNFKFRRTVGNVNTGTGPAETISLSPALLLNPPIGVASVTDQIQSQIERPPLY